MTQHRQPFQLLLVEDSPSDAFLTTEALRQTKSPPAIHTVQDGVDALAFLRREGAFSGAPRPDLILLDLNMPRKDGREVLAEIKNHPDFMTIPVIILTSSSAHQDISRAYSLHANCYVVKPPDFAEFKKVIKSLEEFWFTRVSFLSGE
jgi:CheY-like chemotaxis protein